MRGRLTIILGPTASGKTAYAIERALEAGSPVISCDSRQIYREMSIGTAVPSASQLAAVKHYFIRTEPVTRLYSAGDYEVDALKLIRKLFDEGREELIMCGGSMFYIDAVCNGWTTCRTRWISEAGPSTSSPAWKERFSTSLSRTG